MRTLSGNISRSGITSCVVTFIFIVSFCPDIYAKYSGGTGETGDPYLISTVTDLTDLADELDDWNMHFQMTNDINLASHPFGQANLIGNSVKPFSGVFDGNEHVLNGLRIETDYRSNLALFGVVDGSSAIIKNLGLVDPRVEDDHGYRVGTLVAYLVNGVVEKCYCLGGTVRGLNIVGGLVAENSCNVDYGEMGQIRYCYSTTDIPEVNEYQSIIGGLVGYNTGLIEQCYARGDVTGYSDVGGLVGYCYQPPDGNACGTIVDCYAEGQVSGHQSIGGFLGANANGQITNCCSVGAVSGDTHTGGLIGWCISGNPNSEIVASFWDTEMSGQGSSDGGEAKNTADMMSKVTFTDVGWDFTSPVWTIDNGIDYPRLFWQGLGVPVEKYCGGTGTEQDPYLICTQDDINLLGENPNDWDKYFELANDINMAGHVFDRAVIAPDTNIIDGYQGTTFTGSFDGNDYTISSLQITGDDYLGLFGQIGPNSVIRNLNIEDVNITGDLYVGGICGFSSHGVIINCTAASNINATGMAGGIIGKNDSGTISFCHAQSIIQGQSSRYDIGGLCGENSNGTISNCSAAGAITGINNSVNIGGLCGENINGLITECFADTSVSGYEVIGGLCGFNQHSTIMNSYAAGSAYGDEDTGGLCGRNHIATIENSYSTTSVTSGDITPDIGGLCGFNSDANIVKCYYLDTVGPDNGLGIVLNDSQMKDQMSFENWDFDDIWGICEGTNYPKLQWPQPTAGDFHCPDGVDFIDYAELVSQWQLERFEADTNYDGVVNFVDYAEWQGGLDEIWNHLENWLATGASDADIAPDGGDGFVDWADLMQLCENWLRE